MASTAPCGDRVKQTNYKDISEDESGLNLIDDMEMIRSHDETIADCELGYFDNKTLENIGNLVNGGNNVSNNVAGIVGDCWKFC